LSIGQVAGLKDRTGDSADRPNLNSSYPCQHEKGRRRSAVRLLSSNKRAKDVPPTARRRVIYSMRFEIRVSFVI
jgi:hypothetical protein